MGSEVRQLELLLSTFAFAICSLICCMALSSTPFACFGVTSAASAADSATPRTAGTTRKRFMDSILRGMRAPWGPLGRRSLHRLPGPRPAPIALARRARD